MTYILARLAKRAQRQGSSVSILFGTAIHGKALAMRRTVILLGLVVFLLLLSGGLAWFQRTPLLAWYYVRGLAGAEGADRDLWLSRVTTLDLSAVPRLLDCLGQPAHRGCGNAEAGVSVRSERVV